MPVFVCLTEEVVLKLPLGRMSSVVAATSAMSLAVFPSESAELALSAPRYWSTLSRESIKTASGGLLEGHSISGALTETAIVRTHYPQP